MRGRGGYEGGCGTAQVMSWWKRAVVENGARHCACHLYTLSEVVTGITVNARYRRNGVDAAAVVSTSYFGVSEATVCRGRKHRILPGMSRLRCSRTSQLPPAHCSRLGSVSAGYGWARGMYARLGCVGVDKSVAAISATDSPCNFSGGSHLITRSHCRHLSGRVAGQRAHRGYMPRRVDSRGIAASCGTRKEAVVWHHSMPVCRTETPARLLAMVSVNRDHQRWYRTRLHQVWACLSMLLGYGPATTSCRSAFNAR